MATGFFKSVYDIVSNIPKGKVTTYGTIALMIGRPNGSQVVGYALRCAPKGVPGHRVVNKSGELAPDSVIGGREIQKSMLEEEGVVFLKDGRVDLNKSLWNISK